MGCTESKTEPESEEAANEIKPATVRGCTDVFWLAIYIVFWLFMIAIAVFAFVYGNPLRLINGYDSFGNTCGVKTNERFQNFRLSGQNTIDKPYVFFLDIRELRQTLKLCVKSCPNQFINSGKELYKYYQNTGSQLCRYDFNMSLLVQPMPEGMRYFDILGPCPTLPVYESIDVLHRCVPTGKNSPGDSVKEAYALLNSWSVTQQLLSDLYTTWPLMAVMCMAAIVLSIIVIAMMSWFTNIITWLICVFVTVASIGITIVLWLTYYDVRNTVDTKVKYSYLEEFIRNENALYALAIIATIVMIFIIVIIYLLRSRLSGLAALFEEASKCMLTMPGLIIPSLVAVITLLLFLAFWVAVVVCLITAKYPDAKPLIQQTPHNTTELQAVPDNSIHYRTNSEADYKTFKLVEYRDADMLRNMLWIYFIGLIWTSEFIFACQQLTLAGAVAYWYFRKPTDSPVLHSSSKLIKYHLGSVVKGSLLITIFKIPRLILMFLYTKMKKGADKGSECCECGLKTCICCFWFLEKFLRYLNHNAYTVIAIECINFCPAAGVAWNALMSNSIQVATINGIGDFILFLGKLAIGLVCGLISILLLRHREDVHFYIIPCIFIGIFAFLLAHCMLSLYEMVVDTLFLCVCEDRTINGPHGRWRGSNLAHLLGEEPVEEVVMQTVELTPITKQPFSHHA